MEDIEYEKYVKAVERKIILHIIGIVIILVYMVIVGELGLGDSRKVTTLAKSVSKIILFGGIVYNIVKVYKYKKLLLEKERLLYQVKKWRCKHQGVLYEKMGVDVWDLSLIICLTITCTCALCETVSFYISLLLLTFIIIIEVTRYITNKKNTHEDTE